MLRVFRARRNKSVHLQGRLPHSRPSRRQEPARGSDDVGDRRRYLDHAQGRMRDILSRESNGCDLESRACEGQSGYVKDWSFVLDDDRQAKRHGGQMPRRSSGPKLWFDKARNSWSIIDGRKRSRTGFGAEETARAEEALGHYIASKHTIRDGPNPLLSDVLSAYSDEKLAGKVSEAHILYDIGHLTKWWGAKCVSEISST